MRGVRVQVVVWDDRQAWGPGVVRPSGGWEVMCRQLVEGFAKAGVQVDAYRPAEPGEHNGVSYWDSRVELPPMRCDTLITGRQSALPSGIHAGRVLTAAVDDPRFEERSYDHLRGKSTIVCLSEWQAQLFRNMGHETLVIPSMIDDWIYDLRPVKRAGSYVCVNAWNKGTDATLKLWSELKLDGELTVGSPYGAPLDAYNRCARVGVKWRGQLTPGQVVDALGSAEAVFRVCERPETFGVTDAIAEVLGTRVECLCVNGVGAASEVLQSGVCTEPAEFRARCTSVRGPIRPAPDYRTSTIMPRWLEAAGLGG